MVKNTFHPGPDDHVLTLCHMLANRIGKAFAEELENTGITVAEWRVLISLAERPATTGKEITSRWAMDKMAINRAIKSLQERDLIEKSQNAADKRAINLSLTPAGTALYEKLVPGANDRYHALLAGLNKEEERALRATLLKLINHVDGLDD